MAKAIPIRADHGADDLRRLARASRDASQTRRLLALAAIYDGASRTEAARIGGVGLQIVRDWVARFNAEGPTAEVHGVVRWRLVDLLGWLREEFDVSLSRQTLGRELRRLGFRKLSARPQDHAQDLEALEAFKKTFLSSWRRSTPSCPRRLRSSSGGRTRRG